MIKWSFWNTEWCFRTSNIGLLIICRSPGVTIQRATITNSALLVRGSVLTRLLLFRSGFPMGCYVTPQGVPKDACIISEKYRQASTFYLFNHVDITIYYHSGQVGQFEGNRLVQARVIPHSYEHKNGKVDCSPKDTQPKAIQNKIKDPVEITYSYSIKFEENNSVKWASRWDYILDSMPHTNIQVNFCFLC